MKRVWTAIVDTFRFRRIDPLVSRDAVKRLLNYPGASVGSVGRLIDADAGRFVLLDPDVKPRDRTFPDLMQSIALAIYDLPEEPKPAPIAALGRLVSVAFERLNKAHMDGLLKPIGLADRALLMTAEAYLFETDKAVRRELRQALLRLANAYAETIHKEKQCP